MRLLGDRVFEMWRTRRLVAPCMREQLWPCSNSRTEFQSSGVIRKKGWPPGFWSPHKKSDYGQSKWATSTENSDRIQIIFSRDAACSHSYSLMNRGASWIDMAPVWPRYQALLRLLECYLRNSKIHLLSRVLVAFPIRMRWIDSSARFFKIIRELFCSKSCLSSIPGKGPPVVVDTLDSYRGGACPRFGHNPVVRLTMYEIRLGVFDGLLGKKLY